MDGMQTMKDDIFIFKCTISILTVFPLHKLILCLFLFWQRMVKNIP